MQYLFLTFLLSFATLSSCDGPLLKGASSPTGLASRSGLYKFKGPLANLLMNGLEKSGVQDTDHANGESLGAVTFRAQTIVCQRAIGPRRTPHCSVILKNHDVLTPDPREAALFYQIILDAGGLFFTGESDVIGVLADEIECTRPIVPHPEAKCQFLINVRNATHAL